MRKSRTMPTVWQNTCRRLWSCCAYAIAGDTSSPIVAPQHATVSKTGIDAGLGSLPCINPWMLNTCCSLPKRPGTHAVARSLQACPLRGRRIEMRFPEVQRTNRNHMLFARSRFGSHASEPICCRHLVYGKRRDNAIASEEETTGWTRNGVCFSAREMLLIAHLNPIERCGPARSSAEILNRIN
jgi:hypothetical protein